MLSETKFAILYYHLYSVLRKIYKIYHLIFPLKEYIDYHIYIIL